MQKLLKRTSQVHKQAARRQRIVKSKNASDTRRLQQNQLKLHNAARREVFVSARQAQREDWHLGPLAPRRDVGDKAETYGTVPLRLMESVEKMDGKWKKWGIREGDRVCVVGKKERDKGKIGVVKEVTERAETCKVIGINTISIATPEYMKTASQPHPPVQTTEAPLPLSSVRLVTPVPDPSTGRKRDVIVNELTLEKGKRYIANYIHPVTAKRHYIPWPAKETPEFQDQDVDTLRIEVEQETWVPTLLRAPMPTGVIDELRNKYSKFRTRHEDSYLEMKEEIDRKAKEREAELKWGGGTPRVMLTPVQELNRQRRMERKGLEEEEGNQLTDEVLAGIGETMARKGKRLPLSETEMGASDGGTVEAKEQG
ncbi:MAG: hypothetical protein LQ339_003998 [Xanthoria mediterranea]|nr:MAG: hypothetical protein LQ339_003998 [Xanthoria mediterranea]